MPRSRWLPVLSLAPSEGWSRNLPRRASQGSHVKLYPSYISQVHFSPILGLLSCGKNYLQTLETLWKDLAAVRESFWSELSSCVWHCLLVLSLQLDPSYHCSLSLNPSSPFLNLYCHILVRSWTFPVTRIRSWTHLLYLFVLEPLLSISFNPVCHIPVIHRISLVMCVYPLTFLVTYLCTLEHLLSHFCQFLNFWQISIPPDQLFYCLVLNTFYISVHFSAPPIFRLLLNLSDFSPKVFLCTFELLVKYLSSFELLLLYIGSRLTFHIISVYILGVLS